MESNRQNYKEFLPKHQKKLEIIHFNDVYNIEQRESEDLIKAGAARFVKALDTYGSKDKLVLFSGDLFFPSNLSNFYNGSQMIVPFNRMNVDISCLGNHELDNGLPLARKLIDQTCCPWILSNFLEIDNDLKPILGLDPYYIIDHQQFKIGFVGLADESWIDTLSPEVDCKNLKYVDYNEQLQHYSKILKEKGCDLVISLNHMRKPEDLDMAQSNSSDIVDLIFGGHDHCYFTDLNKETDVFVVKSGTDFECFTNLTVLFGVQDDQELYKFIEQAQKPNLTILYSSKLKRLFISEKVLITEEFEPDTEVEEHVQLHAKELNAKLEMQAGYSAVDIEGRFSRLRTEETNLGNLVADLIRSELNTDFGLGNGGGLRANFVFEKGPLKLSFMTSVLPMTDQVVRCSLPGKVLKEIIEQGISQWPKLDGRWPVTSGLRFSWDPSRPAGDRIIPETFVKENGEPILMDAFYSLAVKNWILAGKDGYTAFLDEKVQKENPEEAPTIQEIFKNWLDSFAKPTEELKNLPEKKREIFERRLKLLGTSVDNRCPTGKYIMICPTVDGRINNIGESIKHDD